MSAKMDIYQPKPSSPFDDAIQGWSLMCNEYNYMHDLLKFNLLLSLVFHKVSYYFSSVCKWDDVSGNKRVLFAFFSLQSFSDASQNDCKEKHANKGRDTMYQYAKNGDTL